MLFILLAKLTDDGLHEYQKNPDTFADAYNSVDVPGTQLLARYATLGQYDFVVMVEADGAQQVSQLSVALCARAHVHIESMQATGTQLTTERPGVVVAGEETGVR